MKKLLLIFMISVIAVGGIFANGEQEGNDAEKVYEFKYANNQNEAHSRTISMVWFAEELEKRSNGRIKAEVYHSGVLGTEEEMFEMCVNGQIQGYRGGFFDRLSTKFFIYNLPFLFQSYDEMIHFNASSMARDIMKEASVKGIYIPAVGYTGFRAMINNTRLVKEPADMEGIKVRGPAQGPILEFYQHFKANPQEIAWAEVYMAFKRGVVDGVDNSPSNLASIKLQEIGKYFTALNYMAGADPFMVNDAWYKSLPEDLKVVFNETAVEALQYWDQMEKEASAEAVRTLMEAPGVEGVDMEQEPRLAAMWEEAAQPLWQKSFVDKGYFSWDEINRAKEIINEVR